MSAPPQQNSWLSHVAYWWLLALTTCYLYYAPTQHCIVQTSWCGDGVVDEDAGEECDDGNSDDHDSCNG